MISLHPQCAALAGGREMVSAQRAVFALQITSWLAEPTEITR
jgi:hypothetical protein